MTKRQDSHYEVEPMTPFGAVVRGLDLSRDLELEEVTEIQDALNEHHVLVFRGHTPPTDPEYVRFTANFGEVAVNDVVPDQVRPGYPEIIVISNIIEDGKRIGAGRGAERLDWHSDYCWAEQISKFACLEAMEIPSEGGETWFGNMYAFHDALPEDVVRRLEGLQAVHETDAAGYYQEGTENPIRRAVHPLIIENPLTGRRAIYANHFYTRRILDVPEEESQELLNMIFEEAMHKQFIYEHQWQVGDLVMWDEVGLVHGRNPYDEGERRYMRQITALIDEPASYWPTLQPA